jgi:hypothetical protein
MGGMDKDGDAIILGKAVPVDKPSLEMFRCLSGPGAAVFRRKSQAGP